MPGHYDAIILASAGLKRLAMADRITQLLDPSVSLPAIGQGAIGIECRSEDVKVNALVAPLNDAKTQTRLAAERATQASSVLQVVLSGLEGTYSIICHSIGCELSFQTLCDLGMLID